MKFTSPVVAFHLLCSHASAFSLVGSAPRRGVAKTQTALGMSIDEAKKIPKPTALTPVIDIEPSIEERNTAVSDAKIEAPLEEEVAETKEEAVVVAVVEEPWLDSKESAVEETKEQVVEKESTSDSAEEEVAETKEEAVVVAVVEEPWLDSKESAVEETKEQVVEKESTSDSADVENQTFLQRLGGTKVTSVKRNEQVELSSFLKSGDDKSMLILGTYAADFNAIEYVQRLRFYLPQLQERGIRKIGLVLNCEADAAKTLVDMLDLETDATSDDAVVELFIDPAGVAGRNFGVGRGWKANDKEMSPYVKLFGMLFGLGAWATLPAVIGGYIGNPFYGQPWIEDAIAVGQTKKRWPNTALELDESGQVVVNKFKELPYVGGWERRPLELATLRLQNMMDISIKNWKSLAPTEEALKAGILTQLGAAIVIDCKTEEKLFSWRDPGICAVANFEDILKDIPVN